MVDHQGRISHEANAKVPQGYVHRGTAPWHIAVSNTFFCSEVAFEAVSPILDSRKNWEVVIETFWTAYRKVFHLPKKFKRVGSHVHISVPGGFRLDQLKDIAKGIALHEDRLYQILPVERRDSKYCKPNTEHSNLLNGRSLREIYQMIDNVTNKRYLVNVMQGPNAKDDRYVLWNFANIVKQSETLEFRGGRCLRGEIRTKRWIAFTVGFVEACLGAVRWLHFQCILCRADLSSRIRIFGKSGRPAIMP